MAKKNIIETLVSEKKKEFEEKYGQNFHSMFEFEGIIRSFIQEANGEIKSLRRIHKLLSVYTTTQEWEDQLKIEATRVELKDSSLKAINALISCAAALDNFNFNEMINEE